MNSVLGILIFALAAALAAALLTRLSNPKFSKSDSNNSNDGIDEQIESLVESVNQKLPQTQCAQCGYPGCRPYANAIIKDDAPINQCPPGGQALIENLAEYLGKEIIPLDEERGENKPPQVVKIVEADCIGCTLCILACPVDAIVGASRLMHTVIGEHCTGCELCIPPCPVDCIELVPINIPLKRWHWPNPS